MMNMNVSLAHLLHNDNWFHNCGAANAEAPSVLNFNYD